MPRYGRYLFTQYLVAFLTFALMFSGMVYIIQAVQLLDKIEGRIDNLVYFIGLTLLMIPELLVFMIPVSLLLALLTVNLRLTNDNELVILSASGQSRWQIARYAVLLGLGASLVMAFLLLHAMPSTKKTLRDQRNEISQNLFVSLIKPGAFSNIDSGLTVYVHGVNDAGNYHNVMIYDSASGQRPVIYIAEEAGIIRQNDRPGLILKNGRVLQGLGEDNKASLRFEEYTYQTNPFQQKPKRKKHKHVERYLSDLFNPEDRDRLNESILNEFRAAGHKRIADILTPVVVAMIVSAGTLTGLSARRKNRRRAILCCGLSLLYIVFGVIFAGFASKAPDLKFLIYTLPAVGLIAPGLYIQHMSSPAPRLGLFGKPPPGSPIFDAGKTS